MQASAAFGMILHRRCFFLQLRDRAFLVSCFFVKIWLGLNYKKKNNLLQYCNKSHAKNYVYNYNAGFRKCYFSTRQWTLLLGRTAHSGKTTPDFSCVRFLIKNTFDAATMININQILMIFVPFWNPSNSLTKWYKNHEHPICSVHNGGIKSILNWKEHARKAGSNWFHS